MDGSYLLRRSRYGELPPSALKKKKLEVFEIMENLCLGISTIVCVCVCVCLCACVRAWERQVLQHHSVYFFSFFLKTIAGSPSKVQVCLKGKASIYFFMRLNARFASDFA
jgi:hypothetical protein